jgi:hypothetical protein
MVQVTPLALFLVFRRSELQAMRAAHLLTRFFLQDIRLENHIALAGRLPRRGFEACSDGNRDTLISGLNFSR